jgi:phospholipase/carboxylesterase
MNRIALSATDFMTPAPFPDSHNTLEVATQVTRRSRRPSSIGEAPLATFAPLSYEPGYAYPLIVWLHGSGGNERQLRQVMPHVSMRNYVAAAPRGTAIWDKGRSGFDWLQRSEHIEDAESRVFQAIAAAEKRYNIHDERVFLVGSGSGGTMALRIAWNNPQRFAGAATLGGPAPKRLCPLRCVNQMRHLPCLIAASRRSKAYPERRVCGDLRLLHSAGCTLALRQYPGGEELTTVMLADLNRWLMELVCGRGVVDQPA